MKTQRLRFRYRVTEEARDINSRDFVRAWESAVAAAGFALAYSEGKRHTPQIALAAPLPMGVTSCCELVDVFMAQPADPQAVLAGVARHLPAGVEPLGVSELGPEGPSLQSQLRWAEYEVTLGADAPEAPELHRRIDELLRAASIPSEYVRTNKVRAYDLRPLVLGVEVLPTDGAPTLRMRLRAEQDRTARADQVLLALGIEGAARIHRTRLELDVIGAGLRAHRAAGEPTGDEVW